MIQDDSNHPQLAAKARYRQCGRRRRSNCGTHQNARQAVRPGDL